MPAQPTLVPPPTAPLPPVRVKAEPEDFIVEEVPLYVAAGIGTHTYLWIEKRGVNTLDAVRHLSRHFGQRERDAGIAGLKDARAVTRQWISVEHIKELDAKVAAFSHPQIRILETRQHGNKLKMGHLKGNRFRIRLRAETQRDALLQRCNEALQLLFTRGVPNYFGAQRFGRYGDNTVLGRLLVRGEVDAFEKALTGPRPERRLRNLFVNAFQSELFNQVLARRLPEIGRLLPGDLALLHRNGAVFAVTDAAVAAAEQPRADALEISPSGPLFGPKVPLAEGEPGKIENEVLAASGVTSADFGRPEAGSQPGVRRALRVPFLEAPAAELCDAGVDVRFALPSGSYATVVLREILGDAPEISAVDVAG